jgi:hypothetical protein
VKVEMRRAPGKIRWPGTFENMTHLKMALLSTFGHCRASDFRKLAKYCERDAQKRPEFKGDAWADMRLFLGLSRAMPEGVALRDLDDESFHGLFSQREAA